MPKSLTIGLCLLAVAVAWYLGAQFGFPQAFRSSVSEDTAQDVSTPEAPRTIQGQGKLEPASGLINIVAAPGERIESLIEKQVGDQVEKGEALVTLHSRVLREKDLEMALARRADALKNLEFEKQQATFKLAAAQLAVDEANASETKLAEQAKAIGLLENQVDVARQLLKRLQDLQANPATKTLINQTDIDKQSLLVQQLRLQIEQGQVDLELAKGSSVRAKEVARNNLQTIEFSIANAQDAAPIRSLDAAVALAQQAFDLTQIRSPIKGTILQIFVREGDSVTNQPIMLLADLSRMNCEVEIVDSFLGLIDIQKHKNLRARITGSALKQQLMGTAIAKSLMIGSVSMKASNPFAKVDQRTGVVTIRLDDPETAARFVNLQVDVEIEAQPGSLPKTP